jgi:hypothetical protein
MRLRTLTLCTALVAATLGTPTLHAAPFTPEQEARIKELIRETLIANPKILDEAAESWEKQNAAPSRPSSATSSRAIRMCCSTAPPARASAPSTPS